NLAVPQLLVALLERLGQRRGEGFRVVDRRVAIGVGEGFRQRAGGEVVQLRQRAAGGLLVGVRQYAFAEAVLDAEHLEEVELQVSDVALVVAHVVAPLSSAFRLGASVPLLAGNIRILPVGNYGK